MSSSAPSTYEVMASHMEREIYRDMLTHIPELQDFSDEDLVVIRQLGRIYVQESLLTGIGMSCDHAHIPLDDELIAENAEMDAMHELTDIDNFHRGYLAAHQDLKCRKEV